MTARNYDLILKFNSNSPVHVGTLSAGNVITGNSSAASGTIANIDLSANTIKVKLSNTLMKFQKDERFHANVATTRVLNVDFKVTSLTHNVTSVTINNLNYGELNQNLTAAMAAMRTDGNTVGGSEVTTANALILPIPANNKNEITVLFNNTHIHSDEYIWSGDLGTGANQFASFGSRVQLNSQSVFDIEGMASNAIVFKYSSLTQDANYTVRVATANLKSTAFEPAVWVSNDTIASGNIILEIENSPYIAEKNAFTQNPIVRLIDIYYPGEWYPPKATGNPGGQGSGLAWPHNFPFRIAEINGDIISDINYNVTFDGGTYKPYPINISAFDQQSDGEINELTVNIFNFENIISTLIEDPFLAGNNKNNSAMAIVNGEYVNGIDPRTINMNPQEISDWSGFPNYESSGKSTANLAANILHNIRSSDNARYKANSTAIGTYGSENVSWSRDEVLAVDRAGLSNWDEKKIDSRDLLGAVVTIKSTFANFLDVWPEYSVIKSSFSNTIEMYTTSPYRVGDNVKSSKGDTEATIQAIEENRFLFLDRELETGTTRGDAVYIVNTDADPEAYLEDVFKIDSLDSLNDTLATFTLTSWLQYFKYVLPKRKFYKNTCQWEYKGEECQYPGPGGGNIPGTSQTAPTTGFAADNSEVTAASGLDVCGKSLQSCSLRYNEIHFGGFPATGRTIPRQ